MFEFNKITSSDEIDYLNKNYVNSLLEPMDGMWYAIIANSVYQKITIDGLEVGYFCLDSEMRLLRLELFDEFKNQAQLIFSTVLDKFGLKSAIVSTVEPFYLSLCLDFQKQLTVHSYLFHDERKIQDIASGFQNLIFRVAERWELDNLECFYRENTTGEGDWIRGFLEQRISFKELFILSENQTLLGTGECIVSQKQKPYADVGIVVSKMFRSKGLGTYLLSNLKLYCESRHLKPICSCTKENVASRKAIQKAGFVSKHRILDISF